MTVAVAGRPAAERQLECDIPRVRTIRVALAGCGVVGGELVRLLHSSAAAIRARHGVRVEVVRVLVRDTGRSRDVPLDGGLFTDDLAEFVAAEADVVIEAIGGREHAELIARAALGRGARFVTANKELVASSGAALADLARVSGGALDFGAAVGGSVPVISTLRHLLGTSPPAAVRGILNGTSNYILSQLERGVEYDDALAAARRRGLAEADCTRDMDGRDTAAKLAIVAWVCFGIDPATLRLRRTGLLPDAGLVRHAAALGARVRLIGECAVLDGGRVAASVEPVVVPLESAWARTEREDNRIEIDLGWAGPLAVSGPGAGGAPTATSLLADLLSPSGPPHNRAGHRRFTSVDDPRAHSWLVAAPARGLLSRALRAAGIAVRAELGDDTNTRVVTEPCAWTAIDRIVTSLAGVGTRTHVARVDLPVTRGSLS